MGEGRRGRWDKGVSDEFVLTRERKERSLFTKGFENTTRCQEASKLAKEAEGWL